MRQLCGHDCAPLVKISHFTVGPEVKPCLAPFGRPADRGILCAYRVGGAKETDCTENSPILSVECNSVRHAESRAIRSLQHFRRGLCATSSRPSSGRITKNTLLTWTTLLEHRFVAETAFRQRDDETEQNTKDSYTWKSWLYSQHFSTDLDGH